ncbi:MAG TPA: glycosyltransferase [Ignavibacteriaceae bacterium]|nr:glycosyltransferase [Ignavibacteriaceae bacterium]
MDVKRISLLTSGHPPFDERIFWKFAKSLCAAGFKTSVFCSTQKINIVKDDILIKGFNSQNLSKNNKIVQFFTLIESFEPDIVICSEMLPVFAALRYKRLKPNLKVILDVTEWYPENVVFKFIGIKRWLKYIQLILPYIYIIQKVNHIIIGEHSKKRRYDLLASNKPKSIIGYYPVLEYFNYKPPDLSREEIVFGYAGVLTFERGIINLVRITNSIAHKYQNKKIKLLIFGKFTYQDEEKEFHQILRNYDSIKVEFVDWMDYDKMSQTIERMDICFDLRVRNFIYINSLPIKIFEYMACGKPFIYSDIKPVSEEINIEDHGFLVNPENDAEVIEVIENYLNNPNLALRHSENSRKLIEEKKNWETESKKLIDLVNTLLS